MSKRKLNEDSTDPPELQDGPPVKVSRKLWRPHRRLNAEDCSLLAIETPTETKKDDATTDDKPAAGCTTAGQGSSSTADDDWTLMFPVSAPHQILITSRRTQHFPSPFVERTESARLHRFAFKEPYLWTPEVIHEATLAFIQQIKAQLDPEVGGEPVFYFPSSASCYVDVTFRHVKAYRNGQKLRLSWQGSDLLHKKVGVFLSDDHIVLGLRGIGVWVDLHETLLYAGFQLRNLVQLEAVRIYPSDSRLFSRHRVVILARFLSAGYHAGMLPGWLHFGEECCQLHFEDRDDVCEPCRRNNSDLRGVVFKPERLCARCGRKSHCEYTCGHPEVKACHTEAGRPYRLERRLEGEAMKQEKEEEEAERLSG